MPLLISSMMLRWAQIFLLAVGLNCGNFSIERFIPGLAFLPDYVTQVRYFCIPLLLVLGWLRRDRTVKFTDALREPLMMLAALGGFLIYAFCRVEYGSLIAVYPIVEPYLLVFIYAILAMLTLRDADDAVDFLKASVAILMGVAGIYITAELVFGPMLLATGYYYSRAFYIGFVAALFLMFRCLDRADRKFAVLMGLAAALFIFCGIATAMRAAIVLYGATGLIFILLMMTLRAYRRLALAGLIMIAAVVGGLSVSGQVLAKKQVLYSQLSQTETAAAETPPVIVAPDDVARCDARINALAEETQRTLTRSEYSCQSAVMMWDTDARLRLWLTAMRDVQSRLFGNGLGTYLFVDAARMAAPVQIYPYPHNIYIGLFNETGLIGLGLIGLSILFVCAICLRATMQAQGQTNVVLCLLPIFFLLSGALAGDFYDSRFIWISAFIMAAMLPSRETKSYF